MRFRISVPALPPVEPRRASIQKRCRQRRVGKSPCKGPDCRRVRLQLAAVPAGQADALRPAPVRPSL